MGMAAVPQIDSSFTILNKRGKKLPVVWITPDERQFPLFRQMDRDRPIVCLQGRPQREDAPPDSFPEIGRRYQKDIFNLLPQRSYIVVGFCVFAAVAREVALQLAREGASIQRLVMIDPPDPAESLAEFPPNPLLARATFTVNRIAFHIRQMHASGVSGFATYVRGIAASQERRRIYGEGRDAHRASVQGGQSLPPQFRDNHRASISAFWSSLPEAYGGDTIIVRPLEVPKAAHRYPNLRWKKLLPGSVSFREVPGTSESMWHPPHVRVLAETLGELFDNAAGDNAALRPLTPASPQEGLSGASCA